MVSYEIDKEYEPGEPVCGFLYPAFKDRSKDTEHVLIFDKSGREYGKNIQVALNL